MIMVMRRKNVADSDDQDDDNDDGDDNDKIYIYISIHLLKKGGFRPKRHLVVFLLEVYM